MRSSILALLVGGVAFVSGVHAAEVWTCKLVFDQGPGLETRVEVDGKKVLIYDNDASKPNSYDIVENANSRVIAIEITHRPDGQIFVTIDTRSGKFTQRFISVSGDYEERFEGTCTRA